MTRSTAACKNNRDVEAHLKTRASAVKTEQKTSGRMRMGTSSMQCASSPPYSIQEGLVGNACFPFGSSAPNASAPSLLFLYTAQEYFSGRGEGPIKIGHAIACILNMTLSFILT